MSGAGIFDETNASDIPFFVLERVRGICRLWIRVLGRKEIIIFPVWRSGWQLETWL
jgi:hypothetical protein